MGGDYYLCLLIMRRDIFPAVGRLLARILRLNGHFPGSTRRCPLPDLITGRHKSAAASAGAGRRAGEDGFPALRAANRTDGPRY